MRICLYMFFKYVWYILYLIYLKVYKILGNCELQNIPKKMSVKSVKNAWKLIPPIFGHKSNFSRGYFSKSSYKNRYPWIIKKSIHQKWGCIRILEYTEYKLSPKSRIHIIMKTTFPIFHPSFIFFPPFHKREHNDNNYVCLYNTTL